MDLSPRQQKAVFVLVVAVLAALGYWLILPKITHSHGPAQAATPAERRRVQRVGRIGLRLVSRRRALDRCGRGRGLAASTRVHHLPGILRAGQEPGALG